jgi:hypothetical protein
MLATGISDFTCSVFKKLLSSYFHSWIILNEAVPEYTKADSLVSDFHS